MRREQFFSVRIKDNYLTRDKCLINKLKHQEESGMPLFLSKEKNLRSVMLYNYRKGSDRHVQKISYITDDLGGRGELPRSDDLMPSHCILHTEVLKN